MRLNHIIEAQQNGIQALNENIQKLQQQLNELSLEVRKQSVIADGQQQGKEEIQKAISHLGKVMKDYAYAFPIEALDMIVEEVQDVAEEVKQNYEEYATSGRAFDKETAEEQDKTEVLTFLPPMDENEPVIEKERCHALLVLQPAGVIEELKNTIGISRQVKSLHTLAKKIVEKCFNENYLMQLIETIKEKQSNKTLQALPSSNNGKREEVTQSVLW